RRSLSPATSRRLPPPRWERTLPIIGLAEDQVWKELTTDLHHASQSPSPALRIMRYAFTEMLNNAIDHSSGAQVQVQWSDGPNDFVFVIRDDGEGIFSHVRDALALEDHFAAIQELHKGKTTTNPREHTGEGIFFT